MTLRLIGLMSIVLFVSLSAFGLLLGGSRDAVLEEVRRTVSAVGTKTLAAVVEGKSGPDGPAVSPGRLHVVLRSVVLESAEPGARPDEPSDRQRRIEWRAGESQPDLAEALAATRELPEILDLACSEGAAGVVGVSILFADDVATEARPDGVLARFPVFRVAGPPAGAAPEPAAGAADGTAVREELVVQVPTRDYQTIFDELRQRTLALFLGVLLLGTVLSAGVARRFTRPIRELDEGLQRLSAGNLDVKVRVAGSDEVARVGRAFNEMTRRLRAGRERAREMTRKEKLSALGRLAAGIAHDVRNPLHSIGLTLAHLQDTCSPTEPATRQEFDRSLELIRGEIRRLDALVANFLRFARADHRPRAEVALADLLRETAALVAKEAEVRGVTVTVDAAADVPPVKASVESLRSALLNLVLNAFEAMPDGGALVLRSSRQNGRACVEVIDTGAGIAEADRERVFEFGYTTRDGGNGLGLAMVHQVIVEEHGGRVELTTREGEGTAIRLEMALEAGR